MSIQITSAKLIQLRGTEGKTTYGLDVAVLLPGTDKPYHIPFVNVCEGNHIADVFGKDVMIEIVNEIIRR
jgi:hypothetical protein